MPDQEDPLLGEEEGRNGEQQPLTMRQRAHNMVEGSIDTWFEYTLLGVIFFNVVMLVLSTIVVEKHCRGSQCERLGQKYNTFFEVCEWVSVTMFSLEYVMRIWACVEDPHYAKKGAFWGRVSYALTFYPIVDLLSILPNWISLGTLAVAPFTDAVKFVESPDFTTAGRIVRLVRVFKTDKYLNAFSLLGGVLYENRILLFATSFYSGMVWVVSGTLLYYTERDNPKMGTHFQSIPQALFPTLLMLTGEYPLADFTPIGQVISGAIAVLAVAIFAVPTSVLGAGFMQAVQKSTSRAFTVDVD